jgi:hypothetical protein
MSSNRFDRFEYYECLRQQDTLLDEAIARRRLADCPHGPFEHRLGIEGYLYIGARVRRVREAVAESQSIALRELQAKLGGIGLADVWPILREICHDVALYIGGGAVVGGVIGGGLGVFAFGAGALPGAAAGAALGTQAGNLLLGFFGLKSVVAFMLDSLPRATRAYQQGFYEAWGRRPDLGAYSMDSPHYGVDRLADSTYLAASAFARGHEILILALLAGVVAYLTIGKGQLPALLAEVRQSARLGPKMASWLEQNEGKLLSHPLLNERARGNGGGAIGGGAEVGASASGQRTGNQTTTGTAPRDGVRAVGDAKRKVPLEKNTIRPSDLGELLGRGGNKDVFALGQSEAVGVLRAGKNPQLITEELKLLHQLDDLGIPTVNARGPVSVGGQPGLVFDRFVQGSKDIVRLENGKIRVVGKSPLLNGQSVIDLEGIRNTMVKNKIQVNDLQFLISNEGRVVVADPLAVNLNTLPSKNNLRMIDLLIQSAKNNGEH